MTTIKPTGSVDSYVHLIGSLVGPTRAFPMSPEDAALGIIAALVDPESLITDDKERADRIRNVLAALNVITGRDV